MIGQFVRVPRLPRGIRPPRGMAKKLTPVGVLALAAGGLAGVAYFKTTHHETVEKIVILSAVALAVIGGAMALVKQEIGGPIAAGAVTPFIGIAAASVGARISFDGAFHEMETKLYLAAGIVGLILAIIVLIEVTGQGNPALGVVIALLAIVSPVCFAAVAHIDDAHPAPLVAAVVGQAIIAVIIAVGGSKGRFGAVTSVVAAGLLLPNWIDRVRHFDDRKAAALGALLSLIVIIILGLTSAVVATVRDRKIAIANADDDEPALITDSWQPTGAVAPTSIGMIVTPNYSPPPTVVQPRTGPVVQPVSAPTTPQASNGQWATDPYGRYQVRYWNGKKWTHHVSTNGITGSDPID